MSSQNKYIDFSIVLAAKSNNPTILNPDFLRCNNVIDESWKLKQSPICTEPFASVIYENGVSILSQLDKIVFGINKPGSKEDFAAISAVAIAYLKLIPHVNYHAIGINPRYILYLDNGIKPEKFILETFIIDKYIKFKPLSAGFNISFDAKNNAKCNFSISSSIITEKDGTKDVILVGANFHHNVTEDIQRKIIQMESIINSFQKDIDFFEKELLSNYFPEV